MHTLDSWPSFAKAVARSSPFWKSSSASSGSGEGLSGSRLRMGGVRGFCHKEPQPTSTCSHCLRTSLEERLLNWLPPRSWRSTSFGRESSSVQALATPEGIGPRPLGPLFGMWVVRGIEVERTSSRSGGSGAGSVLRICRDLEPHGLVSGTNQSGADPASVGDWSFYHCSRTWLPK